jgi:beta-glucanase (GH16 family)
MQQTKTRYALYALGTVLSLTTSLLTTATAATPAPTTTLAQAKPASATTAKSTSGEAAVQRNWGSVVWRDEFSYTGRPQPTKWRLYDGEGHAGHGHRRSSAWKVSGGSAIVTGSSGRVTGGMSARFGQKYGRWETRMKTNSRDHNYHPVLLLWPDRPTPSTCPEVDFAESSKDTTRVRFFLHYGCAPKQTRGSKVVDMTRWHNYAVEWTPDRISGYVDGVRFFTDSNKSHLPRGSMHQTLQLDLFPDGSSLKTSTMSIDWVRVYKLQ